MANDTNGKGRLALFTSVFSIAVMLITYSVTVTLVYARIDKEQSLLAERQVNMRADLDAARATSATLGGEVQALERRLSDATADIEFLSQQLGQETPSRRRRTYR